MKNRFIELQEALRSYLEKHPDNKHKSQIQLAITGFDSLINEPIDKQSDLWKEFFLKLSSHSWNAELEAQYGFNPKVK